MREAVSVLGRYALRMSLPPDACLQAPAATLLPCLPLNRSFQFKQGEKNEAKSQKLVLPVSC